MKIIKTAGIIITLTLLLTTIPAWSRPSDKRSGVEQRARYRLWYNSPATEWMTEYLPIGNGSLGAMIGGGTITDEIQFNEKTLWTGDKSSYGAYQNFGSLIITQPDAVNAENYFRELDIEKAIATTSYTVGGATITKEYLSSFPDGLCAINITSTDPGSLDLDISLVGAHDEETNYSVVGAYFEGRLDLLSYRAAIRVQSLEGEITADSGSIRVRGASSVTVYLKAATNYDALSRTFTYPQEHLAPHVESLLDRASAHGYKDIRKRHIEDYSALFNRVRFRLAGTENRMPTDSLIGRYNRREKHRDLFLEELYFHYGRYLMISSARGVDLPSNLQGIWNNSNTPPWSSDIHSNINVQMNYWPAETTNLSELHLTFLNYILNHSIVHDQWKQNAWDSGEHPGWTLYTENNIFGWHGPFMHNYVIANAWYCMHMWQHYRFTLDEHYLRRKAFPVMKTCCDFWLSKMIRDRVVEDASWVCPDEYSPEHGPAKEDATAHAQQLVWDLLNNTLQAIEILGEQVVEPEFLAELKWKFMNLDTGLEIDANGELREWKYSDNSVGEKNHRHLSHLVGLYPGNQISPLLDREIFNAAVKSLDGRGDEGTGWSMGWKVNLWARALDGDRARRILTNALRLSRTTKVNQYDGGIYYNLLDSHAPFQIDGNFGACAGIAEMLLQSHTGIIQILPALPSEWSEGEVEGLRATGNFEVGIRWKNNRPQSISLHSISGGWCTMHFAGAANCTIVDSMGRRIEATKVAEDRIELQTTPGGKYNILPAGASLCKSSDRPLKDLNIHIFGQ